jgi:hypothetical protein
MASSVRMDRLTLAQCEPTHKGVSADYGLRNRRSAATRSGEGSTRGTSFFAQYAIDRGSHEYCSSHSLVTNPTLAKEQAIC